MLVLPGDPFIVRHSSPLITVGGGTVLDPLPRRPRAREASRGEFLLSMERGDKPEILAQLAQRSLFGLPQSEIAARTGWTDPEIQETIRGIVNARRIRLIAAEPPILFASASFEELLKISERVERFHKENPLQPGVPREELRANLARRLRPEIFRAALEELGSQKKLDVQGDLVKRAGSQISLLPDEAKAKDQIETAFASAGLAVPSVKEVLATVAVETRRSEKLLQSCPGRNLPASRRSLSFITTPLRSCAQNSRLTEKRMVSESPCRRSKISPVLPASTPFPCSNISTASASRGGRATNVLYCDFMRFYAPCHAHRAC